MINKVGRFFLAKGVKFVWLFQLSSDAYLAAPGTNAHFVLKHSVGNMPIDTEVDVPLSYADYYYVEALLRYKKWYDKV